MINTMAVINNVNEMLMHNSDSRYEVVTISICNPLANPTTIRLAINVGNSGQDAVESKNWIYYDKEVDASAELVTIPMVIHPHTGIIASTTQIGVNVIVMGVEDYV